MAVETGAELRAWLVELQRSIRREEPDSLYRWVSPENLHVTLHFLGDTSEALVPVLETGMHKVCASTAAFQMGAEGIGFFPRARSPRVLWCGVDRGADPAAELYGALGKMLTGNGFHTDSRPFHPHFTLAYVRKNAPRALLRESAERLGTRETGRSPRVDVTAVALVKSTLTPKGSIYSVLASVPLGAP